MYVSDKTSLSAFEMAMFCNTSAWTITKNVFGYQKYYKLRRVAQKKNIFTYWMQLYEFVIHKIVNFQPLLVYKNGSSSVLFKNFILFTYLFI